jgi:hypothetical protein
MEQYAQAVYQQVVTRVNKEVLDVESFIEMRRNTSGLRPIWAITEFSLGFDLPDEVMAHPTIIRMGDAANDMVGLGNVSRFPFPFLCSRSCYRLPGHIFLER